MLYFAVRDRSYPRNRRIRSWLERDGYTVDTVNVVQSGSLIATSLRLLMAGIGSIRRARPSVVVLSEFSIQYFPVGWILARFFGSLLVTDWFVGLYETRVEDHQNVQPGSVKARAFGLLDRASARWADLVLTDTDVRAINLHRLYKLKRTPQTLPVGAPSWALASNRIPRSGNDALKILYYGNYVPLHGLESFIRALACYATDHPVEMTLIGDGPRRSQVERLVESYSLSKVCSFWGAIPETDLGPVISEHDVSLGVFGASPKATTVIANKVWQSLACGTVVLTRRSDALGEIRSLCGQQLVEVGDSDPRTIAIGLGQASKTLGHVEKNNEIAARLEKYVSARYEDFGHSLRQLLNG